MPVNPLTIAAAQAAGPVVPGQEADWIARVKLLAVNLVLADGDITARCDLLAKIQLGHEPAKGGTKGWGVVTGTLLSVDVEPTTNRGLLTYSAFDARVGVVKEEQIRTGFVTDPDAAALLQASRVLIGHEVRLFKYQEDFPDRSGRTVRMLAHIVDQGAAEATARPSSPRATSEAATEACPDVAGARDTPLALAENEAKERVLIAASGDKARAKEAWTQVGAPEGMVPIALVDQAVEIVRAL